MEKTDELNGKTKKVSRLKNKELKIQVDLNGNELQPLNEKNYQANLIKTLARIWANIILDELGKKKIN